jgi:hypothetical protein
MFIQGCGHDDPRKELDLNFEISHVSTQGMSDGAIDLSVTGGTPPDSLSKITWDKSGGFSLRCVKKNK